MKLLAINFDQESPPPPTTPLPSSLSSPSLLSLLSLKKKQKTKKQKKQPAFYILKLSKKRKKINTGRQLYSQHFQHQNQKQKFVIRKLVVGHTIR